MKCNSDLSVKSVSFQSSTKALKKNENSCASSIIPSSSSSSSTTTTTTTTASKSSKIHELNEKNIHVSTKKTSQINETKGKKCFKFGRILGEGAYSVVQQAELKAEYDPHYESTKTLQEFAIKIMNKQFIKKMVMILISFMKVMKIIFF